MAQFRVATGIRGLAAFALIATVAISGVAYGQGTDVIVGSLPSVANYTADGDFDAFAVGTTSCNVGDETLVWIASTNQHPVIGANMYRLKDGRFEQIGMSWLKHGFTALQGTLCEDDPANPDCVPHFNGTALGVGCSDPYSAGLNGSQGGLGPRYEVNPVTGDFPYPYTTFPLVSASTDRRLKVHIDDLDPDLNTGAVYFVDGHYIHPEDAEAGNDDNNASWRPVNVFTAGTDNYNVSTTGSTVRGEPAVYAWQNEDAEVEIAIVDVVDDGRFLIGYKVTDNEDGTWSYEYAVQNLNSHQSAESVTIPYTAGLSITDLGFHDVEHHSGEPLDGTDWDITTDNDEIVWACTESFVDNEDANALRWGSLFNFRFVCNAPPIDGDFTIGLFRPGTESSVTTTISIPSDQFLVPPTDLLCDAVPGEVTLSWTNGDTYDAVEVFRDGVSLAVLAGTETSYTDSAVIGAGERTYGIVGSSLTEVAATVECVVDVPQVVAITYPNGVPSLFDPAGQILDVSIVALPGNALDTVSPTLNYDIGAGEISVPLTFVSGDLYTADFPAVDCETEFVWWISAESTDGIVATEPLNPAIAPNSNFAADSATSIFDDAETDLGWTVGAPGDNATTGQWVLADPNGTISQPEDDHTATGTQCWVTGNAAAGSAAGTSDVDSGVTTLVSPVYDLANSTTGTISYWRWFHNSGGAAPNEDVFTVEVTGNGTTWVEVETVGPTGEGSDGGWFFHSFVVSEFVEPTDTVQVRFIAADTGAPSLVEAAIDDVTVEGLGCTPDSGPSFRRGDCNNSGNFDISDAIAGLGFIFLGEGPADCQDACDTNDNGALGLDDMIGLLDALFAGGTPPEAPYPDCGSDETPSTLTCESYGTCP